MTNSIAIQKRDRESGFIYMRNGITLAIFLPPAIAESCSDILATFDKYLSLLPKNDRGWASVGATSDDWRPVDDSVLEKCRAQLKSKVANSRKLTAFELSVGGKAADAPLFGFQVIGNSDAPNKATLVQMFFPAEQGQSPGVENLVDNVRQLVAPLPYSHGYCSPGLQWSELFQSDAFIDMRAVVSRYPGFDVQYNELGRSHLGKKIRGARWLTLLGPTFVKDLGGDKALAKKLSPSITVESLGHGIMIRAGEVPELGDRNRRVETPMLRKLARVLEPITLFGEPVLGMVPFAEDDSEFLGKWERRFLD